MVSDSLLHSTLAVPASRPLGRNVSIAVAATVLVAICAHISLPLPFTPVPITLQNFAVVLLGMFLGPRLGPLTMILYLAEGVVGIPVFNPHGIGGAAQLFGPTGGFLLSYPIAAAVAGQSVKSLILFFTSWPSALIGAFLATIVIFSFGAGWLALLLHLSLARSWQIAVAPFFAVEAAKLVVTATVFSASLQLRRT